MNKYKVVFLDWNGTLSKSKFWGHLQDNDTSTFKQTEDTLFGKLRDILKPWMRGEYSSEDICKKVAEETGMKYEKIFSEFVKGCELMELSDPEIPELLHLIKKTGVKIVIATDNMDSFDRWTYPSIQKKYALPIDEILDSSKSRVMKKDMRDGISLFFSDYLKKNNLSYDQCILIDDSPDENDVLSRTGLNYRQIHSTEDLIEILKSLSKSN